MILPHRPVGDPLAASFLKVRPRPAVRRRHPPRRSSGSKLQALGRRSRSVMKEAHEAMIAAGAAQVEIPVPPFCPTPFDTPPAPRSPLPAHIKTGPHQPWLGSPDLGDRAGCDRSGTPEVYRPTPPRDVAAARWAGLRGVRSGALPKTCVRLIAAWRHGSRPCPSRGRRFSHWASWPPGWLVCGATFWRTLSRRWRLWRLSSRS